MSEIGAAGERVRLREQIKRVHALLDALQSCVDADVPCCENAHAVVHGAVLLVSSAGRHDAYQRVEEKR